MAEMVPGVNNAEWAFFPVGVSHAGYNAAKGFAQGKGLFGGNKDSGPQYDDSWFNERESQINLFKLELNGARASYLSSLGNMYNDAYTRFTNNAIPSFANMGLGVDSGAFASALAYKTSEYESQLKPLAYQAQREDINAVDKARSNLWGIKTNAKVGARDIGYQTEQANNRAYGQFAGDLALSYVNPGAGMAKMAMNSGQPDWSNLPDYRAQNGSNKLGLDYGYDSRVA